MGILQRLRARFSSILECEEVRFERLKQALQAEDVRYVGQLLARAARHYPNEEALITACHVLTYKELYFRAMLLSAVLEQQGICKHDRVLLSFENSAEFYIAYFAILQLGAVCVPLNIFLHPKELAYIVRDAGARAIVTSQHLQSQFEQARALDQAASFPPILNDTLIDWGARVPDTVVEIEAICARTVLAEDELCLLLYTSGTTGVPKGVMLSSRNILTNAMQVTTRFSTFMHGKDSCFFRERFFAALPLFHVFAQNTCIWFPFLVGGTVIVVAKIDRKEILEGLEQKPTLFFGVPALYGLLCLLKTAPLNSVRIFVSGGDALPDRIRSAFALVYGRKICSGYGLTEASPVVAAYIENDEAATNVVGKPLAGITCQIRDEHGVQVAPGEVGTLWVQGDNVMCGYYNAPEATDAVIQQGWLCTGDLARVDKKGNVAIIGRSKDLIIHKGFNIYPQEVENVLMSHPAVFRAAVVGREDSLSGQVPIAYVALKDRSADAERMLRDFCSGQLAAYKVPRKIICLDDLPINATGKVDKKRLSQDVPS